MAKGSFYREKEQLYWEYREIAHLTVEKEMSEELRQNVRLTDINAEALQQVGGWRELYREERMKGTPGWNWEREVAKFRRRYRRLELAIWSNETLCGLLIGRVSDRRVVASIHLIQRKPGENPLQGHIAEIGTRWLTMFAMICSCQEISIERPVPELIDFYRDLGFTIEVKRSKKLLRLKMSLTDEKMVYAENWRKI